jgi:hypothetical protein
MSSCVCEHIKRLEHQRDLCSSILRCRHIRIRLLQPNKKPQPASGDTGRGFHLRDGYAIKPYATIHPAYNFFRCGLDWSFTNDLDGDPSIRRRRTTAQLRR